MTERSLDDVLTRFYRAQSRPSGRPGLGPSGVDHVIRTLGLDPARLDDDERSAIEGSVYAIGLRLEQDTLLALAQAFGRAIGRMVDAEAEIVRQRLRAVAPQERAETLDRFLHAARPLAGRLLAITHQVRLHHALRDALTDDALGEAVVPRRSIALVDFVGSTSWLSAAPSGDTAAFVDALHDVAQLVCAGRRVVAAKFVGDGVYLTGPEPGDVLAAALDAVRLLADRPLAVRGGVAHGPLFRRAGDYFGFAVNLASRLAETASPGTVLAVADAVPAVPDGVASTPRSVRLRGLEEAFDVAELAPVP